MSLNFDTEEDVQEWLERKLGRPPDLQVWALMCQSTGDVDGPVRGVIDGIVSPKELTELYADELRRAQHYRQASAPTPPQKATKQGRQGSLQLAPTPQPADLGVVEQVLAIEAARREDVVSFRTIVLGGRLLAEDKAKTSVDAWTLERMRRAKLHRVPARSPEYLWRRGAHPTPEQSRSTLDEYTSGRRAVAGGRRAAKELEFLWCLVDTLMDDYSWADAVEVERFVLAGETPHLLGVAGAYLPGANEARTGRYVLHVSALTSPRDLMQAYSEARQRTATLQRFRAAGELKQALAVHAAQCNDGSTWEQMMEAWNEAHPDATYGDPGVFTRRCRDAYLTVMGAPLDYVGGNDGDH